MNYGISSFMTKTFTEIHNVHCSGNGKQPVVFAHGFGCDQTIWRYVSKSFEKDYRVVLFDFIGSGKSDLSYYDEHRHASLHGYAEDLLNICRENKLTDIILIAHSVSCMIGMLAAIREPALFSKIIMIAPSPCFFNDGDYKGGFDKRELEKLLNMMEENFIKWASFLGPAIMGNPERPELGEELKERFCSIDHEITKKFARATFHSDHRGDLKNFLTPTLILQCREDILAPPPVGKYLEERIQHSEIIEMEARGHCPHLSEPAETVKAITGFLEANR